MFYNRESVQSLLIPRLYATKIKHYKTKRYNPPMAFKSRSFFDLLDRLLDLEFNAIVFSANQNKDSPVSSRSYVFVHPFFIENKQKVCPCWDNLTDNRCFYYQISVIRDINRPNPIWIPILGNVSKNYSILVPFFVKIGFCAFALS